MTLPRITIVTPSFNQGRFLERTIRSVLDQGYENLQYGIVDGGSTDGSLEVIERYRQRLDFVIVERDGGQSEAINKGLRRAGGEVVGWLNSDDLLLPGALRTVGRHFALHRECQWLIGCARNIDADDRAVSREPAQKPTGDFTLRGALLREHGFNVPQPATFFHRRLISRLGLLDESLHYCMDFELWCRFLAGGVRPALIADELAAYRFHDASKSCAQADRFIETLIAVEKRYAPRLEWRWRLWAYRKIGYQGRALAVRQAGDRLALWGQVLRRPWWLASQQVRQALWDHPRRAA